MFRNGTRAAAEIVDVAMDGTARIGAGEVVANHANSELKVVSVGLGKLNCLSEVKSKYAI